VSAVAHECIITNALGVGGSVLESVQLALARQDVKERETSDDIRSRSDDSYSPRRHWCPV
jgi:hypothetical protein